MAQPGSQAVEQRIHDNGFMEADADLTTKRFRCVKVTGNYTIGVCTVAGEAGYGVLQNKPNLGEEANVRDLGVSKIIVGAGGLTANDLWQTDANGAAIVAASGDVAMGRVLAGAAATEIACVTVGFANNPVLA